MASSGPLPFGAIHAEPSKGHDRLFLDGERFFFGALDGAGGDELSQAAVDHLPDAIAQYEPLRQESQKTFMAHTASSMDSLPEAQERRSTAALACVGERDENVEIAYVNFGDSSIYFFNRTTGSFEHIAHTPTSYVKIDGLNYVSTREFLGAGRTPEQISKQVGQLVLPSTAEWSLIGLTDGVQDDSGRGISAATLEEIVRYNSATNVPREIMDNFEKYDDAAVFIIEQLAI